MHAFIPSANDTRKAFLSSCRAHSSTLLHMVIHTSQSHSDAPQLYEITHPRHGHEVGASAHAWRRAGAWGASPVGVRLKCLPRRPTRAGSRELSIRACGHDQFNELHVRARTQDQRADYTVLDGMLRPACSRCVRSTRARARARAPCDPPEGVASAPVSFSLSITCCDYAAACPQVR